MNGTLRWIAIGLGSVIVLLVIAVATLSGIGDARANQLYDIAVSAPAIPSDAAALERGAHLAAAVALCTDCHTETLAGQIYFEVPGMLSIPSPNLTAGAGGIGAAYTDEDWVRAIRHGVARDGRALFIMPSQTYQYLSDEDLAALIAYVKSVPPADNVVPERRIALMGRVMLALGMFPPNAVDLIDHDSPPPAVPEKGITASHGEYLAAVCKECHGESLNGKPFGPPGQEVPTPNLTPGGELASWSEGDFLAAMRSGVTPDRRQLSDEMPWRAFGRMADEELKAIWLYLQSLPALPQVE